MSDLDQARRLINRFDDYLEYAYRAHPTAESLRDRLLSFLDEYTTELRDEQTRFIDAQLAGTVRLPGA